MSTIPERLLRKCQPWEIPEYAFESPPPMISMWFDWNDSAQKTSPSPAPVRKGWGSPNLFCSCQEPRPQPRERQMTLRPFPAPLPPNGETLFQESEKSLLAGTQLGIPERFPNFPPSSAVGGVAWEAPVRRPCPSPAPPRGRLDAACHTCERGRCATARNTRRP